MIIIFEPAIKWSGSKRSQAEQILNYFPNEISTYYEPFCGGCSVLKRLLDSNIKVNRYVCSDLNQDLINLWLMIKSSPIHLAEVYEKLWKELNIDEDKSRKREYFNTVRDRYNSERRPEDFLFIMRTTTNGMPRYNKNGEFNNSFHITRNGIQPNKLYKILQEWSNKLNQYQVEFYAKNYDQIRSEVGDLLYLDPPYFNTKGMYYGTIDYKVFL